MREGEISLLMGRERYHYREWTAIEMNRQRWIP
jgi:hypothetical protein